MYVVTNFAFFFRLFVHMPFTNCLIFNNIFEIPYEKAIKYLSKACDLNEGLSCSFLAELYHQGKVVKQDFQKAKKYFSKACDLNVSWGCMNFRSLYEKNNHVK